MEHTINVLLLSRYQTYINDVWMNFVYEDSREEKVDSLKATVVNVMNKVSIIHSFSFAPSEFHVKGNKW